MHPPLSEALAGAERSTQEEIARVISERFGGLEPVLAAQVEEARAAGRSELAQQLGERSRAMSESGDERQWRDALLDSTIGLCSRSALFSVRGQNLRFEGARGPDSDRLAGAPDIPLSEARAFLRAVSSREVVTAECTGEDLPAPMAGLPGESPQRAATLFPMRARDRVVAVLYAEDPAAAGALEALVAFAGAAFESHLRREANAAVEEATLEHAAARRFARVAVANIVLREFGAVRAGRESRTLYASLSGPIDRAREDYRANLLGRYRRLPDYLHREILSALANDQPELLGPDYPGPLA